MVWIKHLYPFFSKIIEKLPLSWGKIFTWILILFMSCNIVVSCMALAGSAQRKDGIQASDSWQMWVDEHYNDERLERIYPNAKSVK